MSQNFFIRSCQIIASGNFEIQVNGVIWELRMLWFYYCSLCCD